MTENKSHINYTIEDIERYLNGGMTPKEMHDMELASLKDPFLADAIEGYSEASFQTSYQHLNEINAALYKKKEETKVVPIAPKRFYWLNAAAVVAVVVITGALSWYLMNTSKSPEKNEVAATTPKQTTPDINLKKAEPVMPALADTPKIIAEFKKEASSKPPVPAKEETKRSRPYAFAPESISLAPLNNTGVPELPDSLWLYDSDILATAAKKFEYEPVEGRLTIFKGRVTDKNNMPIAGASVIAEQNIATVTDNQGHFSLISDDSLLNVHISSLGFESGEAILRPNAANNIAMKQDIRTLSEVVTTEYKKTDNALRQKRVQEKRVDSSGSYPSAGWESFREYVDKQLGREPDTAVSYGVVLEHGPGNVELEFAIGKDGVPENFKVLKSLDSTADSKAIEIVKNGPKWIAGKNTKTARVSIGFNPR